MSIEIKISQKLVPYKKAMLFLNKRVEEVKLGQNKEIIWILEHPTTYTAGISFNKKEILDKSIKIIKTNRGGKITLHNPNQKIIYFAINLNKRKKDIRKFINCIENSIIEFLKIYKIKAMKIEKLKTPAQFKKEAECPSLPKEFLKFTGNKNDRQR